MVVFNYYRELCKDHIQFDFYYDADSTVEPPESLLAAGARFYQLPPYQKIWKYIPALYRYLKQGRYQIVHAHINTLCVFPLGVAWFAGIPVRIAHNHSVPNGYRHGRDALKYILRPFSHVFSTDCFACSEKAGRWLFGRRCYQDGRVKLLYNAIDFQRFLPSEDVRKTVRESLGISGRFVMGHVGRFTFAKNHRMLLEIFRELLRLRPDGVLLLVGDGELRSDITAWSKTLGIEQSVIMTGNTSCPESYYPAMDVAVFPSLFEGFCLTALEAQACGVPVLLSNAIPREAVISTGYHYMSLKDSPVRWAKAAVKISGKKNVLTEEHLKFDIHTAARTLERWYLDRLRGLSGEGRNRKPDKGRRRK